MANRLHIRTANELSNLFVDKIVCVVSDGNYSSFVLANGERRVVTFQLGEIEQMIAVQPQIETGQFVRIGKSLIVNMAYVSHINLTRQQLVLSDNATFSHTLSASREALRRFKQLIEEFYNLQ